MKAVSLNKPPIRAEYYGEWKARGNSGRWAWTQRKLKESDQVGVCSGKEVTLMLRVGEGLVYGR